MVVLLSSKNPVGIPILRSKGERLVLWEDRWSNTQKRGEKFSEFAKIKIQTKSETLVNMYL